MSVFLDLLRSFFLTHWISEGWFEWLILALVFLLFLLLVFLIFSRTALRPSLKATLIISTVVVAAVLWKVPDIYRNLNKGIPDPLCPTITFDHLTGTVEPVRYIYLGYHAVPGPRGTGFVDFFVLNTAVFGANDNAPNSHVCRVPFDTRSQKLVAKLAQAEAERAEFAKKAGIKNPRQAGDIQFTLPGTEASRAQLEADRRRSNPKRKRSDEVDDSFGHAEFNTPQIQAPVKSDTPSSPAQPQSGVEPFNQSYGRGGP